MGASPTLGATAIDDGAVEDDNGHHRGPGLSSDLRDQNKNGLADGLEARLPGMAGNEAIDVVVTLVRPAPKAAIENAIGAFGLVHEFKLIDGFTGTVTAGQARALARLPFVFRVEPVYRVVAAMEGAKASAGVDNVHQAFSGTGLGRGAGVDVCVVDSGLQWTHELFDDNPARFKGFYNLLTDEQSSTDGSIVADGNGHGTHVTSILAGDGTGGPYAAPLMGIVPEASLYIAKVLDSSGFGQDSDVAIAVEWCALMGADAINLSLIGDDAITDGSDAMSQLVNAVVQRGTVVVAGVGNNDVPHDLHPPAVAHLAIAVGAYGEWSESPQFVQAANGLGQGNFALAAESHGPYVGTFSSMGITSDGRIKPDIMAPDVTIAAAYANILPQIFDCGDTCYEILSGTSMATPIVTGIVALMREVDPNVTPDAVRRILFDTAEWRGEEGGVDDPDKSPYWGFGMVNAHAAVDQVIQELDGGTIGGMAPDFPAFYQSGQVWVDLEQTVSVEFSITDSTAPLVAAVTGPKSGELY